MATKTPFAGLTALDPDESLAEDAGSFQSQNPYITDRFLRRGALHEHTGAPGLADPTAAPVVSTANATGLIPAEVTILVTYTLVDGFGGETAAAPVALVTTADALEAPDDAPTLELQDTGGSLVVGGYTYGVTITDGHGGETPLGGIATIQRDPGPASAQVLVSGLSDLVATASGSGWRLYRSRDGDDMHYLASGGAAADSIVDDGHLCADCSATPPSDERNSTNGQNTLTVEVPAAASAGTAIRVYATTGATFSSPALLDELPPGSAGASIDYPTLTLDDGSPPDVSQSIGMPSKIDAESEIENLYWRTPVANAAALPGSGNVTGDARVALAERTLHVWDGDSWESIAGGGGGGGGHTIQVNGAALPARPNLNIVGAAVAGVDDPDNDATLVGIDPGAVWTFYAEWSANTYPAGSVVTHDGVLWLAEAETDTEPTEDTPGGWRKLAVYDAPGSGPSLGVREDVAIAVAAVDLVDDRFSGQVAGPVGYKLLKVTVSAGARVRVYGDEDSRDADVTRDPAILPAGDHGVMFDLTLDAAATVWMTPPLDGYNRDGADVLWWTVDSLEHGNVTVTLTVVRTEAVA